MWEQLIKSAHGGVVIYSGAHCPPRIGAVAIFFFSCPVFPFPTLLHPSSAPFASVFPFQASLRPRFSILGVPTPNGKLPKSTSHRLSLLQGVRRLSQVSSSRHLHNVFIFIFILAVSHWLATSLLLGALGSSGRPPQWCHGPHIRTSVRPVRADATQNTMLFFWSSVFIIYKKTMTVLKHGSLS